jgi:hypothetical protein
MKGIWMPPALVGRSRIRLGGLSTGVRSPVRSVYT